MLLTLKNRLAEVTHSQREERPAKINPWFVNFLAQKLLEKEPQVSWELWHFKRQAPPDDLGSAEARVSLEEAEGHLFLSLTILLWKRVGFFSRRHPAHLNFRSEDLSEETCSSNTHGRGKLTRVPGEPRTPAYSLNWTEDGGAHLTVESLQLF